METDPVNEIKRVMERENVTQADLKRLGVDAGLMSRILRGLVSPSWRTVQRIARALGCVAEVRFRKKR